MTPAEVAATLAAQDAVDPLVVELARALSLATRVETELVRLMRLELFPQSDVGLEGNLWFSPLVEQRDVLGLSFVPECREELRRQLTLPKHRSTLERAWGVITSCHRGDIGLAPVLNVQEAVTYHALASASPTAWSAHRQAMQLEFGSLIKGLDDDTDSSLARWIASALPALPEAARQSPAAIALAEKLRAADPTLVLDTVPRAAVSVSDQGLQWPADGVAVGVRRRTDGIEFRVSPPDGGDWLPIQLPDTSPLTLQVMTPLRDGWHTEAVTFDGPSCLVADPTPASRCRVTSVSGQRVAIQPALNGKPTLTVRGLHGPDDPRARDIATVTADLGWHLRTDAEANSGSATPADAVLWLGEVDREALARTAGLLMMTPAGVVSVGSSEPVLVLQHGQTVFSAEFSPDGSRIATAGAVGVQIWDATTGRLVLTTGPSNEVARAASFDPDGRRLAIGSNDGHLRMLDADTGEVLQTVAAHDDWVMSIEFTRTGRRLVTASQDHSIALWNVGGGLQKTAVINHRAAVYHASFSPNESRVATAAADGTLTVIDVQTGAALATLRHEDEIRSALWSADGRAILSADIGGRAWLWNAATYERDPQPFVHDDEIHFAAFSPDGRRMASATGDGLASVWHVPSRARMAAPLRHAGAATGRDYPASQASRRMRTRGVYSVAFSPDGTRLLTGAVDGRALVWDLVESPGAPSPVDVGLVRDEVSRADRLTAGQLQSLRAQLLALDEQRLIAWGARSTVSPDVDESTRQRDRVPIESLSAERGSNALIAVISEGIDVLHETFLDASGQSRIVGIWDQTDPTGPSPAGFETGTYHDAAQISRYVSAGTLPSSLAARNRFEFGTHVASVAAGRSVGSFAGGPAADARILVVVPRTGQPTGYSDAHLLALTFIDRTAASLGLPVVVNVTHGMNAGAHDGTSPLELAFDEFSKGGRKPGRVIVKSAGNEADAGRHAEFAPVAGMIMDLSWTSDAELPSAERIELWWNSVNEYKFRLVSPDNQTTEWVDRTTPEATGRLARVPYRLRVVTRHIDNGDGLLILEFGNPFRTLAPGKWALSVEGVKIVEPGAIHAWMERSHGKSRFVSFVSQAMTLTVPATARSVLVIGAVSPDGSRAAPYSSWGPTRDGRQKPDVAAPGDSVVGARAGSAHETFVMSGSSMASAHVSGVVALVLSQAAGSGREWPHANQIGAALRQTTRNHSGVWSPQIGYGIVDPAAFLDAFAETPRMIPLTPQIQQQDRMRNERDEMR